MFLVWDGFFARGRGLGGYGGEVFGRCLVGIARAKDFAGDREDAFDEGLVDGLRLQGFWDVDVFRGLWRNLFYRRSKQR